MALVLRTNGAPLSGALFVSNPRKSRRTRRRRNGVALTTNSNPNRSHAAMRALRNRMAARRNTLLLNYHGNRSTRRSASRRNSLLLNYHGNGLALRTNKRARRNGRAVVRRNSYAAFQNRLTVPVENVVGKAPVVGSVAKQYVAPLLMGAIVGGVHYGAMFTLSKIPGAAGVVEKVNPVKYTLTGVVAATALRFIPVGSQQIRDQIAVGALLAGSAIDVYRFLTAKVSDLGDADEDDDFETAGLYEDGFIEAGGLYEDGFIEAGDGGMYDVVPFDSGAADLSYSGASNVDAAHSPPDLSVEEGQAAVAGKQAWVGRFGPAPAVSAMPGYPSPLVGRPGHRFGWLIRLVGFERFQKIAALPPEKRVALIAKLQQQAIQSVDGYSGVALTTDMSGVALTSDLSGVALTTPGSSYAGLGMDLGAMMHAGSAF